MISSDRTLVGGAALGDAVLRHAAYGNYAESIDILVYTKRGSGLGEYQIASNVRAHPSNSRSKLLFFFDALRMFKNIQKERRIDLIVAQDPFIFGLIGLWLKKKYGVKLEINFHGDFWENESWLRERFINRFLLWLSYFTAPRADILRAVSVVIRDKLLRRGITKSKIAVIPTPVNEAQLEIFDSVKVAEIKNRYAGKKLILFAGRLHCVKNLPFLLEAFALVRKSYSDVVLIVAGDGPERLNLEQKIKEPGLYDMVFLLGLLDHKDLINYYHAVDLLVLPSLSEGMPKVLVEGGFCGLPVIATNFPSAAQVIKDGENGFIVPMNDKEKLAERILFLLKNDDARRKMGEANRAFMKENFSKGPERLGELWRAIVFETLNPKP